MISCLLYRSDLRRCRWTRRSDHHHQRRLFAGCCSGGCGCGCGSTSASTCTTCTGSLLSSESEASSSQEKLLSNPKVESAFVFENFPLPPHLQACTAVSPFSRFNWKATVAQFPLLLEKEEKANNKRAADDHDTSVSGEPEPLVLADLERHVILGAGSFGQVQLVSKAQPDGTRRSYYALKVQTKTEENANDIVEEMNIMKKLQHPFVVNLEASCEDENSFYFQMPLLQGGDLSDRLTKYQSSCGASGDSDDGTKTPCRGLPEDHAKFYAFCIADALAYLHSRGCVHRDLKPENVMIDNQGYPVVVDLGLAIMLEPGEMAYDPRCGTQQYMAYEVVYVRNSGYGCSVDHWSLGALIYELVTGHNLYHNMRKKEKWQSRLKSIAEGNLKFPKGVSENCMDLIRKLLVKDPSRRLGSLQGGEQDILNHPWFDGLDMVSLRQRKCSNVPWVPTIHDPLDTSNFTESKPLLV